MKFEIGEKVVIYSKSTGRDLHKAMSDVRKWIEIDNNRYPIGWIIETSSEYYVISYIKDGLGTDYYKEKDLRKIIGKYLEDDLFEI